MAANMRLLDSDRVSLFASHDFSRVLAGNISAKKLVFLESYGDADALDVEFGPYAVAGNDGVTFTEISLGEEFSANTSTLSIIVNSSGGSIPDTADLRYKISARDADGFESAANSNTVVAVLNPGSANQVVLSWTAVTGATDYRVYSSIDGGITFKLIGTTANLTFSDNTGAEGAGAEPASTDRAYRVTTWGTTPLTIGTMAIGTKIPVYVRENVPLATTSAGNRRHHKTYISFN